MSVSSIGGPAYPQPVEPADLGGVGSVSEQLAVLMLNTQEQQKETERQQLEAARDAYSAAVQHEVQALRDQADAAFHGAVLEGAMSVASSGLDLYALKYDDKEPHWESKVACGLGRLAKPLGTVVGKSYGGADAKSAQGEAEAAKWQLDDAHDALSQAEAVQGKALDWAAQLSNQDAATSAAILSNMA